jgi:hypothetical protein
VATLVSFNQQERVISLHSRAQTPPANSAVRHELVNGALDVYTERVPGELRPFVQFVTLSKVSTSPLAMGERDMMPALLTTTSICPKALRVFSKSCLTSSGLARSAWTARARPPERVISLTTSSALAALPA